MKRRKKSKNRRTKRNPFKLDKKSAPLLIAGAVGAYFAYDWWKKRKPTIVIDSFNKINPNIVGLAGF